MQGNEGRVADSRREDLTSDLRICGRADEGDRKVLGRFVYIGGAIARRDPLLYIEVEITDAREVLPGGGCTI